MYRVYAWMCLALGLTASTAYYVSITPAFYTFIWSHQSALVILFVAQLALVVVLSMFIQKISFPVAVSLFVLYAISLGITLSAIFMVYTMTSIFATFAVTSGMFGAMAIYGYVTKADLSSMGSFLFMALIGLIIGGFVNIFLKSEGFQYVLSAIGVLVFTLLTAYDVQKIKRITEELQADRSTMAKVSLLGALTLYLDFINLFLYMLQFMGKRKE
jgi:FtsH-binding integral membrane protein